jgi:hypothetical protein
MVEFKNIEEVVVHIESLLHIDNKDITDIEPFQKIFKLSAERFAKRFDLDKMKLVKEFNQYKKKIHKKIIIYNKVKQLKKVKLNTFTFYYSGVAHRTKPCMCSKLFESKFKHRTFTFYPEVKYLYVELDEMIVLFPRREHIKLYSTKKEFNEHFLDMREYKINQIIQLS